jgi:hypothetical protein
MVAVLGADVLGAEIAVVGRAIGGHRLGEARQDLAHHRVVGAVVLLDGR